MTVSCSAVSDSLWPRGLTVALQARILEREPIPFPRVSSRPRDQTWVSCIANGFFTIWATRECGASGKEPTCNSGDPRDTGLIPGSGRSLEGDLRHGSPGTHSRILAWRIPWTEEPRELQSLGSQRVGHNLSDLAHKHAPYDEMSSVFFLGPTIILRCLLHIFWLVTSAWLAVPNYIVIVLKSNRTCHPKICLFGIRIILSNCRY